MEELLEGSMKGKMYKKVEGAIGADLAFRQTAALVTLALINV